MSNTSYPERTYSVGPTVSVMTGKTATTIYVIDDARGGISKTKPMSGETDKDRCTSDSLHVALSFKASSINF